MEQAMSRFAERFALLTLALLVVFGCASPGPARHDAGVTHWDEGGLSGPIVPETYFQPPEAARKLGSAMPFAYPVGAAGGDLGGNYPNPPVQQCTGASGTCSILPNNLQWINTATPTLGQAGTGAANSQAVPLTISSQGPNATNGTAGNVVVSLAAPTGTGTTAQFQTSISGHNSFVADNQGVVLGRTDASQSGTRFAPLIGQETTFTGMWTGANASAPSGVNYHVAWGAGTSADVFGGVSQSFASGFVTVNSSAPQIQFAAAAATPTFQQNMAGNTSAPQTMFLVPQTPGASCSSTANCTPGSFEVQLGTPGATGSPADAAFIVNARGNNYATLQPLIGSPTGYAGLYMMPSVVPSATNYTLANSGATVILNAPPSGTGQIATGNAQTASVWGPSGWQFFGSQSLAGGSGVIGVANATTAPTGVGGTGNPTGGIVAWSNGANQLNLLGSTSAPLTLGFGNTAFFLQPQQVVGTGATVGVTTTISGQQGQQQTGGSANNAGGALNLTSGPPGTGGGGAAAFSGPVNIQVGNTTSMTVGPTASGGGPAGIGLANQSVTITASSNTTFTLTAAQYQRPMILLTGTLTSAAVATVAFPNVTAMWWVDDSGVTFTSGSINFTCGGGTASASVSSLVTTSEIMMVSCRGTTVSLHTENDVLPLPNWRYAANDVSLDPCDERRRAA